MPIPGFRQTFGDDFNSFDWSADGSHGWKTKFYFGGRTLESNGEKEFYSDSTVGSNPFTVGGGELHITASPGWNFAGLPYNSGLITTEGMFSQLYGYFEIRAKLPAGQGMWPAFWLLPTDKSWPPEIDPLEAFGAPNANGEGGATKYHWGSIGGDGNWVDTGVNLTSDFHTYGVDWQADKLTFYFDGRQVGQSPTPALAHKPMYMLANLAVGGNWPGNPDGRTATMDIDYIRAYTNDPNAGSAPSPAPSAAPSTAPSGSGPNTLTLHLAEDAWQGDAMFTVAVDGSQIGGPTAVTALHSNGAWQDFVYKGDFGPGPHTVAVGFVNDAWGGTPSTDRNLYLNGIELDGQHYGGETPLLSNGTTTLSTAAGGSPASSPSPVPTGSGANTLIVHVAEDAWRGDAMFTVAVDGRQVGGPTAVTASHAGGGWQDVVFKGDFGSGAHTVAVAFVNDAWGGTPATDRNLYVNGIELDGKHYGSETPLLSNGTATFSTAAGATPAPTPTPAQSGSGLILHLAEDAWQGDAQFVLRVDGKQIGGPTSVTAKHGSGQWQDFAFHGDFGVGQHTVEIAFTNDGWGGSPAADRNLYVKGIDVDGHHYGAGETPLLGNGSVKYAVNLDHGVI